MIKKKSFLLIGLGFIIVLLVKWVFMSLDGMHPTNFEVFYLVGSLSLYSFIDNLGIIINYLKSYYTITMNSSMSDQNELKTFHIHSSNTNPDSSNTNPDSSNTNPDSTNTSDDKDGKTLIPSGDSVADENKKLLAELPFSGDEESATDESQNKKLLEQLPFNKQNNLSSDDSRENKELFKELPFNNEDSLPFNDNNSSNKDSLTSLVESNKDSSSDKNVSLVEEDKKSSSNKSVSSDDKSVSSATTTHDYEQ